MSNNAGQVCDITDILNSMMTLSCSLRTRNFISSGFQRHKNRSDEGFHHIMVEVESLSCKLVNIDTNLMPIFIKRFQSVQHYFQIQHRPLRVQVIDLDIGQKLTLIGFREFFSQDLSNGNS